MTERESAHPVTHQILDVGTPIAISSPETQLLTFSDDNKSNQDPDNENVNRAVFLIVLYLRNIQMPSKLYWYFCLRSTTVHCILQSSFINTNNAKFI